MASEERYGVAELAEEADVSVRTVRYYIAEGLLPPAVTAGARSYYTREHLDRLRAIGRLKDAYLPLREIRRQLAALDAETIHQLAEEEAARREPPAEQLSVSEQPAPRYSAPPAPSQPPDVPPGMSSASEYIAKVIGRSAGRPPASRASRHEAVSAEAKSEPAAWRRIPLGDDAELLIREDAYQRRRDKVDWLIDWARKVFGSS